MAHVMHIDVLLIRPKPPPCSDACLVNDDISQSLPQTPGRADCSIYTS